MQDILQKTSKGSSRILYLDFTKFLAIALVVWGHVLTSIYHVDWETNRTFLFIYSFHMPLFMMVSGFFARSSFDLDFISILKKKTRQLIIPALAFGVLVYIVLIILGGKFGVLSFIKYEIYNFWFLKSLFLAYLIGWICWRAKKYRWIAALAILVVLLASEHFGITIFREGAMLPFFLLGILVKEKLPLLYDNKGRLFFLSLVLFLLIFPHYRLENTFLALHFSQVQVQSFFDFSIYLVTGVIGSAMILSGAMILSAVKSLEVPFSAIAGLGKFTLAIYLWQNLIVEILIPAILSR